MSPNYANLLQELWYTDQPNLTPSLPEPALDLNQTNLAEFLGETLAWDETFPSQAGETIALPSTLPLALIAALRTQGIDKLYSHQLKTRNAIRAGKDVVLTVPTAAGKTLAAYVPVLEGVLAKNYRCLSLYGLKALASDQTAKLDALLKPMNQTSRPRFVTLTGDVKKEKRQTLLATNPHLLAITPDLLHFELKQVHWSEPWQQFLAQLRYVVIDELHSYTGVFGANMHWLLQRLKLAVDNCGGNSRVLQFICLSATVGNPKELASNLIGRPIVQKDGTKRLVWIHKSGATRSSRHLVVTQPNPNSHADAAKLIVFLMQQGLRGIVFCNAIDTTKRLTQLVSEECRRQHLSNLQGKVAAFYGSLDDERRQQVISQLERGNVLGIVATSALEAGIDLPQLDFCVVLGFPGTLLSFLQRSGRAGRKNAGLVVYIPKAQSLLDTYFSDQTRLLGQPEAVHFNPNYPITIAKHLLCAAAESGIPRQSIKRYFGADAVTVAQTLLAQGHLQTRRDGTLYAKGFPHGDINFRGGVGTRSYNLVDTTSNQTLETMTEDQAYRQVYPGAIYQVQTEEGQMQSYRSEALEPGVTKLVPISNDGIRTQALAALSTTTEKLLAPPMVVSLHPSLEQTTLLDTEPTCLTLELGFGTIAQSVRGYSLESISYERTCLNKQCLKHKTALPETTQCPLCHKRTRDAEVSQQVQSVEFETPYTVQFQSPILSLTLNAATIAQVEGFVRDTKLALQNRPDIRQYQALWECPSHTIAVHSLGHQLMKALPLTVMHSHHDLNFFCRNDGINSTGLFFDTSDGGNGATEAILRYWDTLVPRAIELIETCECEAGCPKCLSDYRCPDQNKGLVKQVGLFVLKMISPT